MLLIVHMLDAEKERPGKRPWACCRGRSLTFHRCVADFQAVKERRDGGQVAPDDTHQPVHGGVKGIDEGLRIATEFGQAGASLAPSCKPEWTAPQCPWRMQCWAYHLAT
jgi:hypothetical protein